MLHIKFIRTVTFCNSNNVNYSQYKVYGNSGPICSKVDLLNKINSKILFFLSCI